MREALWILPILVAIAVVLGGCRAESLGAILRESSKTFGRILGAIVVIVLVLQVVLWFIPRIV
jgi:hypothetical protein